MKTEVAVERDVLQDNLRDAAANRAVFDAAGVFVVNLMSGAGAGKTTLLERTALSLREQVRLAVIAADLETRRDADRIEKSGVRVIQINTGGACHVEAHQIAKAVATLDLSALDLLVIENVGNLVCPAEFDLGEHAKVMILSCAEGHDKPAKYPLMFREAQLLLLNKADLLPYTNFDVAKATADVRALNPKVEILQMSATTGDGLPAWLDWLRRHARQRPAGASQT